MKLNLFGQMGLERGRRETAKLLILLTKGNSFRELWREGIVHRDEEGYICRSEQNSKGGSFTQVYLLAPYKYQSRVGTSHPMLCICDNGGELNIQWVNQDETCFSVPYVRHRCAVNAETVHTWLIQMLDGETPDFSKKIEALSDEDYKVFLRS